MVRIIAQGEPESGAASEEVGWYAMELVEGDTLATRLQLLRAAGPEARGPLLEILRRLCATLAVVHAAGLVHRDLSPRNVIIRPDGTPVLVDFGFALANAGVTAEREVLQIDTLQAGTLLYSAPEQLLGEPTDARSDLYSLGCIIYEALTGRPPFRGREPRTLIDAHLSAAPRAPSQLEPSVTPALDQLVLSLLAKRPAQRPPYADQVGRVLTEQGVPGGGSTPQPTPASPAYLYRPGLIGRQAPISRLERMLEACEGGRGGRVFITGESGVGKTRLALELAARARRLGMQVVLGTSAAPTLQGTGDARLAASALQPCKPLLKAAAQYCIRQGRQESLRVLGPRGRLLAEYEPALAEIPCLSELPRLPPLPGDGGRFRLFDALEHLLVALAARRPVVLILDDLQWADELTLAFVCERLGSDFFHQHAVLIAALCRDEELPAELGRALAAPELDRLALPPLDAGAVSRMIDEMLGSQPAPPQLTEAVKSHACGNPLFVVEYLRTALTERRLVRAQATWRLTGESLAEPPPSLPTAVRQLVHRRLDRLSPRAQLLTELAAVLGREFSLQLLLATADGTACVASLDEGMDLVAELVIQQVLEPTEAGHYRFVHDQLREISYLRIPDGRRRSHHARAAAAIELSREEYVDFGRNYAALAAHYLAAEDDRRALVYLERAANRALLSGSAREAQALCTQALELSARTGLPRRIRLHRLRAEAHFALADLPACEADATEVLRQVLGKMPSTSGGWIRLLLAQLARQLLHRIAPARWVRSSLRARPDRAEGAVVAGLLASVYYFDSRSLPMITSLVLGANLAERAQHTREIIGAFARLGYVAGLVAGERLAAMFFDGALRLARDRDDQPALALTLYLRAFHELGQGRLASAEEVGTRAVRLLEQVGDVQSSEVARTIVGHALYFQGRFEETARWYTSLHQSARRRGNSQHMGWALTLQARALLMLGRTAEAVPLLEEGRLLLAPLADRMSIAMCEGLLASAYLLAGRPDDARNVTATLTPRLRGPVLPLAPCLHGYLGALSVALADCPPGATPDPGVRRSVRAAARRLRRFAQVFPLAQPAALMMGAALARRDGDRSRAARLQQQALLRASVLHLARETLEPPLI